ncbi:hypothetical protein PAT3040_05677, partial [Paenibacillus agaridevorans]
GAKHTTEAMTLQLAALGRGALNVR